MQKNPSKNVSRWNILKFDLRIEKHRSVPIPMDILYICKPSNYPFSCQTIQKLTCTCSTKSMKDNLIWLWLKHNAYNYVISQHTTWIIVMQLIHNHTIKNDYIKQIIIISIIIYFLFLYIVISYELFQPWWIILLIAAYCMYIYFIFHYFEIHHYNPIGNRSYWTPTYHCVLPSSNWLSTCLRVSTVPFFYCKTFSKGDAVCPQQQKSHALKKT